MGYFFKSFVFVLVWLAWVTLSSVVLVAACIQAVGLGVTDHEWKPWLEMK